MKILVTGGAGFIGSTVIRKAIMNGHCIINVDSLTYAACLKNLENVPNNNQYFFEKIDIRNSKAISEVLNKYEPDAIMNLAAESHVDRSIDGPGDFIQTNIVGTYNLLECSKNYWQEKGKDKNFRFLHVSTDEVFGSAKKNELFREDSKYLPNSPYAASKASSDHLVRAWHKTFNLPTLVTNCSNNYGPYQFPEKLIPLTIINAIEGRSLPIYGDGKNSRDWLHVEDHADALLLVLANGEIGKTYNIGANNELENIDLVKKICEILDKKIPTKKNYSSLITFVDDRPGHDFRYAIDASRINRELKWSALIDFDDGLERTVKWYISNKDWWEPLKNRFDTNKRIGIKK